MKQDTNDKLTLYMIGHAPDAHYLRRLLDTIKPIVRGIAFVNTDDKADCRTVIEQSGIPHVVKTLTYHNRADFNFSECRNMAMDMAQDAFGGWLMWLDCDDMVDRPERILTTIQAYPGKDGYAFPYDVGAQQDNIFKTRIHRHSGWRWTRKVHEELVPENKEPLITLFRDIIVTHSPDEGKSNHDFHISLLEQDGDTDPNAMAYLMKEHFHQNRHQQAIEWAHKVIENHPRDIEVYAAHLTAGVCHAGLEDMETALDDWNKAIRVMPHRREAHYYIAEVYASRGYGWMEKALAYVASCNAQIDTHMPGQNRAIYACAGYKLHAKILQAMGYHEQAHEVIHRAKEFDDEAKDIARDIEARLRENAIERRDAA